MTETSHPTRSWLGVPYATAERFHRPVLVPFNPDLPYDSYGPAPLQAGDTSWLEASGGFSEDCLNLNIWAPVDIGDEPLPVVVYMFGGGWLLGSNTQTTSNLSRLASSGRVIGVSINYRLGPFGWLSLSQYGGRLSEASNLGLQDVIAALQWIHENISRFGGDPGRVTVTGHSAGAFNALSLLGASSADGLYHRIAAFSGMPSRKVPAWGAEERAIAVLTALGIQDDPEAILQVEGPALAKAMAASLTPDPGAQHGVDNDGVAVVDDREQPGGVLTALPMDVLASGAHRDVDILFSSTSGETDYWVAHRADVFDPGSLDDLVAEFAQRNRIPRSRVRQIIQRYEAVGRTPIQVRSRLLTDFSFTLPQVRGALAHAAAGGNAHLLAIGPTEGEDAFHGTELYGIVGLQSPDASDEQIVRDNFVRDCVLALAEGKIDSLWPAVDSSPTTKGIGTLPYEPTQHAAEVLDAFEGIARP